MSPSELLAPMLVALGVAVAVLVAAGLLSLWKPTAASRAATWLAPAIAFLAGGFLVRGLPAFPPLEAADWVASSVALIAIVALFVKKLPPWSLWIGRILAAATLTCLIARPLIGRVWEGSEAAIWLGGIALVWLILWTAILQSHSTSRAWQSLLILLVASLGLSVVLMISGTASYSQYILALAGAIAGAGLAALPFARRFGPDPRPAAAMVTIPWAGLLIAGYLFVEMSPVATALTAVAPLALFFPSLPKLKKFSSLRLLAIQLAWTILLLAIAVWLAYRAIPKYDYYY